MIKIRDERQLHAYCVGQAKSGTASLWGACRTHLRAAHEPERAEVLSVVLQQAADSISADKIADWLRERDARLQLDVDISWCNFFLLDQLITTFPAAKFIVLVRDCYTWVESVIGHMLIREIPPDARTFMEFWFRTNEHPHVHGERRLQGAGLFSLSAYLTAWNDHITKCASVIPADRMLIIRTHELTASLPAIEKFLEVPPGKLDAMQCNLNPGAWGGRIGDYLPVDLVETEVDRICRHTMNRYFPEIRGLDDGRRTRPTAQAAAESVSPSIL